MIHRAKVFQSVLLQTTKKRQPNTKNLNDEELIVSQDTESPPANPLATSTPPSSSSSSSDPPPDMPLNPFRQGMTDFARNTRRKIWRDREKVKDGLGRDAGIKVGQQSIWHIRK